MRVVCEDTVRLLSLISDRASFVPVLRVNRNLGASLVIRYIRVIRPDKALNYRHRIIPVRDLTGLRLTQYPFAAPRAGNFFVCLILKFVLSRIFF
ncbi:hypothetical protein HanHA300_Chr04g0134161 [Helianthus annuus]|nr:hypothetical protein HanHA300_Chr04g0134161 [Helianthus annuus]KAJ0596796.1 hypothetical protein HanHA89_Chr04g0147031 [Helianthus annuus]KAJ0757476.1 hypothetical protein HanLR1_Chr04g0139151 [Helianthus annuus]